MEEHWFDDSDKLLLYKSAKNGWSRVHTLHVAYTEIDQLTKTWNFQRSRAFQNTGEAQQNPVLFPWEDCLRFGETTISMQRNLASFTVKKKLEFEINIHKRKGKHYPSAASLDTVAVANICSK